MQKSLLFGLVFVLWVGICFSQSLSDPLSQGTSSQGASVDCSDPTIADTPLCSSAQQQRSSATQGTGGSSLPMRTPVLTSPYGFSPDQYTPSRPPLNPSQIWHRRRRPVRKRNSNRWLLIGRSPIAIVWPVVIRPGSQHVFSNRLDAGSQRLHHRPG